MPTSTATADVSAYVAAATPNDLPAEVLHESARTFLNYVGCIAGGTDSAAVLRVEGALRPFGGAPQALVIGRGWRTDALLASLLNCLSSAVHSFDDTHAEALVHATGPVASALLSLAQLRPVSGRDFALALALGVEIGCRASKAISVAPARGNAGWIQTGVAGGIGAAVAAAKVLRLDARGIAWSIGTAVNSAAGTRSVRGMGFPLIAGCAARAGLQAALLAAADFATSADALEAANGFASMFAVEANLAALIDGLGTRYELLANTYKPYPCGVVIFPAIDACLELRYTAGFDPDDIESIRLDAHPPLLNLADRPEPKEAGDANISVQHWIAATLISGAPGLETAALVNDPAVVELRKRVSVAANAGMAIDACAIALTLCDGRTVSASVEHCRGSAAKPMSDDDLTVKFVNQAQRAYAPARVDELAQACWSIAQAGDIAAFVLRFEGVAQ